MTDNKGRPAALVIATGNAHKLEEMTRILTAAMPGVLPRLLSAADFPGVPEPEETGATFLDNALIKARAWAAATGLPALADDSGLVVDALGGAPGVRSARYAADSPARIARVLDEMRAVPDGARQARFVCVVALSIPGGIKLHAEGRVEGLITRAPRGEGGFGYDPIFELTEGPSAGLTLAEASAAAKDALSHRGRALRAIAPRLAEILRTR